MKTKASFTVILVLLVASIVTNIVLWQQNQQTKSDLRFLMYDKVLMMFRSSLQAGAGAVESPPTPSYQSAGASIEVASRELEILNETLTAQGIPHVTEISIALANIANDFIFAGHTPKQKLENDTKFLIQAHNIMENQCFPKGRMDLSAFPQAFTQIYSLPQ